MSSAKHLLPLVTIFAILLSTLLHSHVHGQVSSDSTKLAANKVKPKCTLDADCKHKKIANSGCLNGTCQCHIGYIWSKNKSGHFNCRKCNSSAGVHHCQCPSGTSESKNKFQCLPDLPPFGLNDKPPSCKTDGNCSANAFCYKDNHCHCSVAYHWRRPVEGKAFCEKIKCTKDGSGCALYNGICGTGNTSLTCICPEHFVWSDPPGLFAAKCHLKSTFDPPCNSTADCTSGPLAVSGSICNQNKKCTCKSGHKRVLDACVKSTELTTEPNTKLNASTVKPSCTTNADCKAMMLNSRCDQAKRICVCDPFHRLSPDKKKCIESVKPLNLTTVTTIAFHKVSIIISVTMAGIGIIVAVTVTCCGKASKTQASAGSATTQPNKTSQKQKLVHDFQSTNYSKQQSKVQSSEVKLKVLKSKAPKQLQVSKQSSSNVTNSKSRVLSTNLNSKQSSIQPVSGPISKASSRQSSASNVKSKQSSGTTVKSTIKFKVLSSKKSSISPAAGPKSKAIRKQSLAKIMKNHAKSHK